MIVELDVFSGRPNPMWSLSGEQMRELLEAFRDLPPVEQPSAESGLGYRGFLLSNPDRVGGLAPRIRVCAGIVTMTDDRTQSYRDVHDIEHRLFLQASQHGYKDIVDSILEGESGSESN